MKYLRLIRVKHYFPEMNIMKTDTPSFSRIVLLLSFFVTIVLFYLVNVNTPLLCDDYWIIRVMEIHSDGTYSFTEKMISSFRELLQSWCHHRNYFPNGRVSDCASATILLIGGKTAFNVLNTLAFVAYLWVFCKLCFHRFTLAGAAILLLTSIIVNPCITGTVFWVCGALNYLWPSIPLAVFLMGVRKLEKEKTLKKRVFVSVCLCSFLCGAFHEGLGCTLGGAMMLYWVIQRSKGNSLPAAYLWMMACVGLGTLIPLTAPAMWSRLGIRSGGNEALEITSLVTLKNIVIPTAKNAFFPLLLLSICLIRNWRAYVFSLIGCFISMNIIMVIAVGSKGAWGGAYYFLGLGVGIFVLYSIPQKRLSAKWGLMAAVLTLILMGMYTSDSYNIKRVFDAAVSSECSGNPCSVDLISMDGECPFVLGRSLPDLCASPRVVHTFAWYYGKKACHFGFQYTKPIKGVETAFDGLPKNEIHLRKYSDCIILRLPRGCNIADSITAQQEGKPTLRMLPSRWGFLSRITASFRNQKLTRCGQFLAGDTYFIVLPEEVADYSSVEIKLRNQGGAGSKSTVDLAPVK